MVQRCVLVALLGTHVDMEMAWAKPPGESFRLPRALVEGAHPYLKAVFGERGFLRAGDFAAASKTPRDGAAVPSRSAAARLGAIDYDTVDSATCAEYTSTTSCGGFDGDDDTVLNAPSAPGTCAACGYGPDGQEFTFMDCLTCADDGYEIVVLYDDCTGLCADADGVAYYATLGFAGLDDSACTLYGNCYDEVSEYATDGTNDQYAHGGASYSYSYGGSGGSEWGCMRDDEQEDHVTLSTNCDCNCNCDETLIVGEVQELKGSCGRRLVSSLRFASLRFASLRRLLRATRDVLRGGLSRSRAPSSVGTSTGAAARASI